MVGRGDCCRGYQCGTGSRWDRKGRRQNALLGVVRKCVREVGVRLVQMGLLAGTGFRLMMRVVVVMTRLIDWNR